MRRLLIFLALLLLAVPAFAEEDVQEIQYVQQSDLLDAAFSMLEKGNPFLDAYNEITGAGVEARFELGLPYFFGGKHDTSMKGGEPLVFSREPLYVKTAWGRGYYID